jgi:hypothetical protein
MPYCRAPSRPEVAESCISKVVPPRQPRADRANSPSEFSGEGAMLNRRAFLATAGVTLIGRSTAFGQTTPSNKLRIVVVANRYHEADGLVVALCNQLAHSNSLKSPTSRCLAAPVSARSQAQLAAALPDRRKKENIGRGPFGSYGDLVHRRYC